MSVIAIVCGGRGYADYMTMYEELEALWKAGKLSMFLHGAASGADSMAAMWASCRGVPTVACPARWKKHGKAAGSIRNGEMLEGRPGFCDAPGVVYAFPGGAGTADMIRRAERKGIPVVRLPREK